MATPDNSQQQAVQQLTSATSQSAQGDGTGIVATHTIINPQGTIGMDLAGTVQGWNPPTPPSPERQQQALTASDLQFTHPSYAHYFAYPYLAQQPITTPTPPKPNPADNPEELKRCKENLMVEKVQIDDQKRIIITTKTVYIKKEGWKRKKKAGIYEIRIDFSKKNWDSGIEIINSTRSDGSYYHPNIDSFICWGTMAEDVEKDFNKRDLLEVVTDCIDFIQSTNDENSFHKDGWMNFFLNSRSRKASFLSGDEMESEEQTPF